MPQSNIQSNSVGLTVTIANGLYIRKDGTSTTSAQIPFAEGILLGDPASATVPPLRFTSGALIATAVTGGMEYLTDDFYLTITTGAARKKVALLDGSMTALNMVYATTNGRLEDTSGLTWTGTFNRFASGQGSYFNGGSSDYIYGDGTNLLIAAANAVVIGNPGDIILGTSTLKTMYPQTDQMIDLGTASFRYNSLYVGQITMTDATNIVLNSTTGTKIGTATTQKLGFYNATPVVRQAAATDLGTTLANLGLRASGATYGISTTGTVAANTLTCNNTFTSSGTSALNGHVTIANAINIVLNTVTGTKIGTGTSQKLGFFNAAPVVQQGATTDLGVVLSNLGLRASGTAYVITTSGAVTLGSLTSGRIPIAGTAGLLGDDADLTFTGGDTLTVTKIGTTTMTGTTTHTGSMIVKSVTDAGPMTATNGTVAEIVYNTSNSKFYGCTVTGTPATWSALN